MLRYSGHLIFFYLHAHAKPLSQLQKRVHRLNPAVIADVAGDLQDQAPDLSIQALDEANEEAQGQDLAPGKYNQTYVPKSPPHGPDVSPGDFHEKIDDVMGKHAEFWRPEPPGIPLGVKASSCVLACAACRMTANEIHGCKCKATCIKGADSTKCYQKPIGWTNDETTQPSEVWEGKCNVGHVDCSECQDEELQKEEDRCHGDPLCLHKLRVAVAKPAPEHFCMHGKSFLSSCERFTHVPKENNWECFRTLEECSSRHASKPYEEAFGSRNTPCVWCEASNLKDPDEVDE
eukprot:gnl/MRDRNA2_/MRDRNA2_89400_c0_seq1.p1 gnl/MRDRNA2_/MRDRNA2_89400_c0~~gnl/MRDRNA2_/MRDRNA2_89400_c0_seq1.p1  ORF type:complete len:290 (+),score=60.09 gnl/MRDRNA2_/MRDRNA2_89400_c0_seq1:102-971(+)